MHKWKTKTAYKAWTVAYIVSRNVKMGGRVYILKFTLKIARDWVKKFHFQTGSGAVALDPGTSR